ncbi:glycosyltransferase family 4 protein [Salinimicrobium sp. HB62]|uniref:glycosyltransferase family 4 protein n=1 Tax=Salinimicrobium sp. HB62 TaxID=3077781 RepID=UPI002D7694F3|nr:glycosyltransferase family 4 protein [Salinimicrobium sp. HB62]
MTKNFLVLTHVIHHSGGGKLMAYAPYVREMNMWFKNVGKTTVVAPFSGKGTFAKEEIYETASPDFKTIPSFDLLSLKNSLKAVFNIPVIAIRIFQEMSRADYLHLRCPGNVGLIACFCQLFFPKKPKSAKYAGNWDPEADQPWSYKLQKWILKNSFLTRNMAVLVYGDWPRQTANVRPFFTASFSENEIKEVRKKTFAEPFTFLFVGNLVAGKQAIEAIRLIKELIEDGSPGTLEIYGDGPEREKLEDFCKANELIDMVSFKGNKSLEELKEAYQRAHFVILPSRSEGWPKAVAEGMFFGCIPIASRVSCVPWMLDYGKRGVLLQNISQGQQIIVNGSKQWAVGSGQWAEDLEKISMLMNDPEEMQRMSKAAKEWSQQYTLEKFEAAIQGLLGKQQQTTDNKPNSARITTHR